MARAAGARGAAPRSAAPRGAAQARRARLSAAPRGGPSAGAGQLARISWAVYGLLIIYASLYPLEGWHGAASSPFAYLTSPLAGQIGRFDIAVNVLGYAPLGFLTVVAIYPRIRGAAAFGLALLGGTVLSILLEAAQTYLPTRIASNVDVASNVAGAALGAALALRFAPWLMEHGPLRRLRAAAFLPGGGVDFGLVLVGLWVFIQLNPATLLFGAGDLRDLLVPPAGRPRAPVFFVSIEALTAAANLVVIALLLSLLASARNPVRATLAGLVAIALAVKSVAFAVMRADAFVWVTPGALEGLAAGLFLALLLVYAPRTVRLVLAAVLIMAATVLVNLAPPNPYFTATLRVWHPGHFLNFNGLTRLVSVLWPFIALGYFIYLASRRAREGER